MINKEVNHNNHFYLSCLVLVGPRLNTAAAKRFVRNALWEAEEQERGQGETSQLQTSEKEQPSEKPDDSDTKGGSRKRKLDVEETCSDDTKRTRL